MPSHQQLPDGTPLISRVEPTDKDDEEHSSTGHIGAVFFTALFVFGAIICMFSFHFLPLIVISPSKFALPFAIGSGCMMASFSFIRGWTEFFGQLVKPGKRLYSAAYFIGMCGVLWASFMRPTFAYIWIIVFSVMQVVGLAYFLVSYLPGGKRALNALGRTCFGGCKKLCC